MEHRWIKLPSPGQFRGEGEWYNMDINPTPEKVTDDYFDYCRNTGYLPTYVGATAPVDKEEVGE